MLTGQLILTPKGQAKLQSVINAVTNEARAAVLLATVEGRRLATQFAPSPHDEAEKLSEGTPHGSIRGDIGSIVGTSEGGRFLKQGTDTWLQDAIATDPVEIQNAGLRIYGRTGRPSRINRRASFHWSTRRRGMQGPTFPFNHALLQAFEYGGVWVVDPRPGGHALEPEDGVLVPIMTKTLPPHQMYFRAAQSINVSFRGRFATMIRNVARRTGRG